MPLKSYVTLFLCAVLGAMYTLQAIGRVTSKFDYPIDGSFLTLFFFLIGAGVFDLSLKSLAEYRKAFLPPSFEIKQVEIDEVTGTHQILIEEEVEEEPPTDVEPVDEDDEDAGDGDSPEGT